MPDPFFGEAINVKFTGNTSSVCYSTVHQGISPFQTQPTSLPAPPRTTPASPKRGAALLLRVYAVESPAGGEAREVAVESAALGNHRSTAGEPEALAHWVWECVVDVRGLISLPPRTKLSHLWTLPADCLLLEMSNGGLYTPGAWVVHVGDWRVWS